MASLDLKITDDIRSKDESDSSASFEHPVCSAENETSADSGNSLNNTSNIKISEQASANEIVDEDNGVSIDSKDSLNVSGVKTSEHSDNEEIDIENDISMDSLNASKIKTPEHSDIEVIDIESDVSVDSKHSINNISDDRMSENSCNEIVDVENDVSTDSKDSLNITHAKISGHSVNDETGDKKVIHQLSDDDVLDVTKEAKCEVVQNKSNCFQKDNISNVVSDNLNEEQSENSHQSEEASVSLSEKCSTLSSGEVPDHTPVVPERVLSENHENERDSICEESSSSMKCKTRELVLDKSDDKSLCSDNIKSMIQMTVDRLIEKVESAKCDTQITERCENECLSVADKDKNSHSLIRTEEVLKNGGDLAHTKKTSQEHSNMSIKKLLNSHDIVESDIATKLLNETPNDKGNDCSDKIVDAPDKNSERTGRSTVECESISKNETDVSNRDLIKGNISHLSAKNPNTSLHGSGNANSSALPNSIPDENCKLNHDGKRKSIDSNEPLDMSISQHLEQECDNASKSAIQKDNSETSVNQVPFSNLDDTQNSSVLLAGSPAEKENLKEPVFEKLSNEETGFPEFLSPFVTIGRYEPVRGDFTLKGNEALIESPSLVTPFLVKEPDQFPSRLEPITSIEKDGFFNSTVGNFLLGIGLSRVQEKYHRDMVRIKTRRIKKSGKSEQLLLELKNHQNFFLQAKKANEHFEFPYKVCKTCSYMTESSLVLEGHLLNPHLTTRREYSCGYCTYFNRDPKGILHHMKNVHDKKGSIEMPLSMHECPCCIFETNSKVKMTSHLNRCLKYFNHSRNQCPAKDFEFPCLTPKPITVSVVKAYEKSISCAVPPRGRPKKFDNIPEYFHHQNHPYSQSFPLNHGQFRPMLNLSPSDSYNQHGHFNIRPEHGYLNAFNANTPLYPGNSYLSSNNALPVFSNNMASQYPYIPSKKPKKPSNVFGSSPLFSGMPQQFNKTSPELPPGIPQPPRLQGPYPVQMNKAATSPNVPLQSNSLVVCEICDGYIKDLEQLRMHMQLIHKVKIHPKMLSSRPPLNCQKCLWRFFTDHGLERHLLGAHGLVTSNMQDLANKNKDAGCCTICGRVYASKLVAHMNQVHKITLKAAHLSYKCTVCSATFGLYRLFENHVYLVHAGGTKRPRSPENSPLSKKYTKLSSTDGNQLEHVID